MRVYYFINCFLCYFPILAGSNGSGRSMVPPVEMEVNLIRERWYILICSRCTLLEKHTFVSLFIHQPVPPSVPARLVVYHRIDAEAVPNLTETHIKHFLFEHYTELSIRCYT